MKGAVRGMKIGEKLVLDSLKKGKKLGFKVLQFNAVVKRNEHAVRLYEKLGFKSLGTIPGGFLYKDSGYEDIVLFFHEL